MAKLAGEAGVACEAWGPGHPHRAVPKALHRELSQELSRFSIGSLHLGAALGRRSQHRLEDPYVAVHSGLLEIWIK